MAASRSPRQSPTRSASPAAQAAKAPARRAPVAKRAALSPAAHIAAKAEPVVVQTPPVIAAQSVTVEPKPRQEKLVRDSFTMPAAEYALISQIKHRAVALARPAKKSELLRAGLKLLAATSDEALLAALQDTPTIKTGRPKAAKPTDEVAAAGKGKKRSGKKS